MAMLSRRTLMLGASALLTPSCGPRGDRPLRAAMTMQADADKSGVYVWLKSFEERISEDAERPFQIYPSSALGGEAERIELIRRGLIDINSAGADLLTSLSNWLEVFNWPFAFSSYAHIDAFTHRTNFLNLVNADIEPYGFWLADIAFMGGMIGVHNTKQAIRSLDDMRRLRMRAMNASQIELYSAWGVRSAQVAWEEVPQALETGIVDGYLNSALIPVLFGQTRQIRHFTDLRLTPSYRVIIMSARTKQMLIDQSAPLDAALAAAREDNRTWANKLILNERAQLEAAGITVTDIARDKRDEIRNASIAMVENTVPADRFKRIIEMSAEAERIAEAP
ncbi:MAG: TRAP transporter substrate-binding protein DctP [Pseudomonadota bacterium]